MNSSFPLTPLLKLSPNSITQWVRGFTTNLQVMSSKRTWNLKIFTFSKSFKTFFVKYCKI